ncbi:hypothetical protein AWE51_02480 [Aquimarina aggregata]|uniref:Uncharacterized protein n=1 Tax=Aquimarina aggregata TaxID=1642818 RepID=A0A163CEE8_9FLAO|nr:hypothetical protein AWE51_02480 [Aquimarina aggregata]
MKSKNSLENGSRRGKKKAEFKFEPGFHTFVLLISITFYSFMNLVFMIIDGECAIQKYILVEFCNIKSLFNIF